MDQTKTGRFLASLRRQEGWTQQALGERLGVTNKTVSRWERGTTMPDVEMLGLFAKTYAVSVEELLRGERLPESAPAPKPTPIPKAPDPSPSRREPLGSSANGAGSTQRCLPHWPPLPPHRLRCPSFSVNRGCSASPQSSRSPHTPGSTTA